MNQLHLTTVLDRFLDPVADCFTPEVARRIVDLKLDAAVQSRLDELAEKAGAGTLTPVEREEYQDFIEGIDILGIFKAKARLTLLRDAS